MSMASAMLFPQLLGPSNKTFLCAFGPVGSKKGMSRLIDKFPILSTTLQITELQQQQPKNKLHGSW